MNEELEFIGDWVQKRTLGNGSFGEVTLWKHRIRKDQIAIKKFNAFVKEMQNSEIVKLKARWDNEIDVMRRAKCDYIVRSITVEPEDFIEKLNETNSTKFPLLVMEYCEGGDLRNFLCKVENSNGLMEYEIKNILKSLRYAIEYLHKIDITHRDLKPENILIQKRNGVNFYKLADLGYAKEMQMTLDHSVVGTQEYIAPEIISKTEYSKRVDYWSMGVIIFEIICGIRPFLPNRNMIERIGAINTKTSKEIAIIETNIKSKYKKYEHLFKENQITDYFRKQIEEWLVVALELNPKKRGIVSITAPDDIQLPPFYTKIDEILNTKILTIFCLSNYTFLSYPVNNMNNLKDLLMQIEHDTKIPNEQIYIITALENNNIKEITPNIKPIEFYLDDQINSPMIYITQYKQILERKSTEQYVPELICDILEKSNEKLELSCLKEFARQVLYLHRNEQKHYTELLKGLKIYALNLNDSIVKLNPMVSLVNNKTMVACANIKLHVNIISHSKEKLEEYNMLDFCMKDIEEWDNYLDKLEADYKLQEINAKNQKNYESVLRRSKEIIDSKFLEIQDFYNVKHLEDIYDKLRQYGQLSDKLSNETKKILINRCYECTKIRKNLLKSRELEYIQKDIIGIHSELVGIVDILKNLNKSLDKYELQIQDATFKHQDRLYHIYEDFTKQKVEREFKNVYRLNGITNMDAPSSTLTVNKNVLEQSSNNKVDVSCNGEIPSMSNGEESLMSTIACFGGMDTKDLINENNNYLMNMLSLLDQDQNNN